MIPFEDFAKIELKVGKVHSAERVEGSEKLLRLMVDVGELDEQGNMHMRQILAGVGTVYTPEEMVNKQIVVVANLAPRTMMGLESQGMLLAASEGGAPVLLSPLKEVPSGTKVR